MSHPSLAKHWRLDYAAKFVGKWEGFLGTAYLDTIASPPVWTIAFGHTSAAGSPAVHEGDTVSRAEGEKILTHDLRDTAKAVSEAIKHPITFRQRIALISAAYNLGPGILDTLAPMINKGDIKGAANKLLEYDHAGGVVIQGLLNRRRAERWMMLHPLLPSPHRPIKRHRTQPRRKAHS